MRFSVTTRVGIVTIALAFGLGICAVAQDSPAPSLGDVARKNRQEHSSSDHIASKSASSEDEDGPDSGGVWRLKLCVQMPCNELSVTLPKTPKWSRQASEPRPVLVPLVGHEQDTSRALRVFAAESLGPSYYLDGAKRTFLQGWFARPEYFGQGAHLVLDEHVIIDDRQGLITHFTVIGDGQKYRGLSVVVGTGVGNSGFACVFRDEDASTASSVCDAIIKSAHSQILQQYVPRYYYPQTYYPPQYYPQYYPQRRYDDPPVDPNDPD